MLWLKIHVNKNRYKIYILSKIQKYKKENVTNNILLTSN